MEKEIEELRKLNQDDNPANCEGLLGYEEEREGNGLSGEYFNNENFIGSPSVNIDPEVNFDWSGQQPLNGINPDNFSIKWTTYLKVPINSNYIFRTESDDGCAVYLNGQLLINHFMGRAGEDISQDSIYDEPKTNFEEGRKSSEDKRISSKSVQVYLSAGVKYKMVVLYFHSVHNDFHEESMTYLRLYWSSDYFKERIVPSDFFYTLNKPTPLKIYGYSGDMC